MPDYLGFFGLRDHPFRMTPDTDYFYPSPEHKAALESLKYGILKREGFLVLTGEPGMGKTLLIRLLFKELPTDVLTAMVLTPTLGPKELFEAILEDLSIPASGSKESLLKTFRDYLFGLAKEGKTLLLVIDEAQNLPVESLEELRLLSNFETEKGKLLQILLSGQPLLEEKLRSSDLSQLAQRITIWEKLEPFGREEVLDYVRFRLARAGGAGVVFSRGVDRELHRLTGGIPRVINKVMDRALLIAFARGTSRVSPQIVREAAEAAALSIRTSRKTTLRKYVLWGFLGLLILLGLVYAVFVGR
ncbi:ExeA family protein [Thermosulfurimonas dismutans]|uniref:AAA+ ATPase domain-containing protein n=1 Tax=Thermosulfurimonas dismutans TaxID=999894 RepID=A0A179D3B4_9BACT|nr:AAA family ATPase [Thermosulfurimonas dismutans]OAQ20570.1 hypothetical protein TDIS_1339 [Thermosulfurimonas dismutans]